MPLTREDLHFCFTQYLNVVRQIDQINHINGDLNEGLRPGDQRIKQIQIPVGVSESIVYYHILEHPELIGLREIEIQHLYRPRNLQDFDIVHRKNDSVVNIEVKASGYNIDPNSDGLQRYRQHSLEANFVFWLKLNKVNINYHFDLAVFHPEILNELFNSRNNEVLIRWQTLILNYSQTIKLIHNINI